MLEELSLSGVLVLARSVDILRVESILRLKELLLASKFLLPLIPIFIVKVGIFSLLVDHLRTQLASPKVTRIILHCLLLVKETLGCVFFRGHCRDIIAKVMLFTIDKLFGSRLALPVDVISHTFLGFLLVKEVLVSRLQFD